MKKFKYISALIFAGVFLFAACQENEPITFSADSHAAFEENIQTVELTDDISSVEVSVMLVGPHENNAIDVNYEILASDTIAGDEHVTNVTEGNEIGSLDKAVTIPANSSFGTFDITFNHDNIEAGQVYKLVLGLQEGELDVSPAYNPSYVLIFVKQ
ncbi:MAG: hypothetical protein ACOCX0_00155 [Bacteroidota bacterium]